MGSLIGARLIGCEDGRIDGNVPYCTRSVEAFLERIAIAYHPNLALFLEFDNTIYS